MTLNISFAELSEYINKHYGKKVAFARVGYKALCVSYEQHIVFKTITIPINISIEDVTPTSVTVKYDGGFGIDMIICGVLSFIKAKLPELQDVIVAGNEHLIRIELGNISNTQALFETLILNDIVIVNDGVAVTANLK